MLVGDGVTEAVLKANKNVDILFKTFRSKNKIAKK